jgi:S1-C subfamily serine protease
VDLDGEIIGINTAIATRTGSSSGVGFSVPVNLVRWVVEELVAYGKVRRGFLGIEFPNSFNFEQARQLGLPTARGAWVSAVHSNTPAAEAGVRVGDVILQFDGTPIDDENHLINAVSQTPIGKRSELIVWRDRKRVTLTAVLGSWDQFRQQAAEQHRPRPLPASVVEPQ